MIVNLVHADVLDSNVRDILFTLPADGFNDAGLSAIIASRYWTALRGRAAKKRKVGEILTHDTCKDEVEPARRFHALVVPFMFSADAGKRLPDVIEAGLEDMNQIEPREPLAMGFTGNVTPHIFEIMGALARSARRVVVYNYF